MEAQVEGLMYASGRRAKSGPAIAYVVCRLHRPYYSFSYGRDARRKDMSLLLNEDFTVYQLRESYLRRAQDGVGERLISLNPAVLHNPAFRAAGWLPDVAAIRRCYSPPIPTAGAGVTSEYFRAPARVIGPSFEDEAEAPDGLNAGVVTGEDGGRVTGLGITAKQRRRPKEHLEEDDSSDLSDDSDEEEQQIAQSSSVKTARLQQPARSVTGGGLAPSAAADLDGPAVVVTSPSRPPGGLSQGLRGASIGVAQSIRQRPRRDTTTSSELSSENELDPNAFGRQIPWRPGRKHVFLAEKIAEEDLQAANEINNDSEAGDSDLSDDVGEASDLSDEFDVQDGTGNSKELMGLGIGGASDDATPLKPPPDMPPAVTPHGGTVSPKKAKENLPKLARLPAGQTLSAAVPPSLISMALRGNASPSARPFQQFADFSGKGEAGPLWIKIYYPFSDSPSKPIEVPLRKTKDGNPVVVMELIGLALWRYIEEGYKPALVDGDLNVNRWTLWNIEDEEIDFDFPVPRTQTVSDFTSNNNRPPQRRARDKPWDEFGLARATDAQLNENEASTPQNDTSATTIAALPTRARADSDRPTIYRTASDNTMTQSPRPPASTFNAGRNPITETSFALNVPRKEGTLLMDKPQRDNPQSTPRTGAPKTVTVHFTDPQSFAVSNLQIPTTADTYIAELHDHSCKKLNLDKALYVLKVHGTQTVAPSDRTVEALGDRLHLDLVRRRFVGAGDGIFGLGLSGSPGSSTPNAPLELQPIATTPTGRKKKGFGLTSRTAAEQATGLAHAAAILNLSTAAFADTGKKYNVLRKQPLSFAPAHPRTLIITPEYLQILPAAPDSLAAPTGKVTNVAMAMIIGAKVSRKHPKMVRVLVFRDREPKRYDFECATPAEAASICSDIRRGTQGLREGGVA